MSRREIPDLVTLRLAEEKGRVLAQGEGHELVKIPGGYIFRRKGEELPLFTASHGSHACDLYPGATRDDLAALAFFLAGRVLSLDNGGAA